MFDLTDAPTPATRDVAAQLRAPRTRTVEPEWRAPALFEPADDGMLPVFDTANVTADGSLF